MTKFTLIKHADSNYDSEVTMTFSAEMRDLVMAHFNNFLLASGFELPMEEEIPFEFKLTAEDYLAREEDYKWGEAFDFKFENAGMVGGLSDDVIPFPSTNKK